MSDAEIEASSNIPSAAPCMRSAKVTLRAPLLMSDFLAPFAQVLHQCAVSVRCCVMIVLVFQISLDWHTSSIRWEWAAYRSK